MKFLLLIYSLTVFTTIKSQPLEQKLKSAVITAEDKNYMQSHKDAKIISTDIVIYNYELVSLRNWWKRIYDAHHEFSLTMNTLFQVSNLNDSINGKHEGDSAETLKKKGGLKKKKQTEFDGESYFKKKYDTTDPAIKVYEVFYLVNLKAADGNGYKRDSVRMCLYPKDLSEVKSF